MNYDGPGWGWGGFSHLIATLLGGLFSLFVVLVTIALIFLLVRFLLVATKAAHIYVAKNSPPTPTTVTPTKPAATKPATTRPRTPKPPATQPQPPVE